MKKIIRLTENDLTRLVRRVIKEQQTEFGDDLLECAKVSDISEIPPSCYSVGVDLMNRKMPTGDACKKCINAAKENPSWVKDKAVGFMTCVAEKKGINILDILTNIGGMVGDIFNKITSGISKGPGPMY
jgi:hypothetical protein